MRLKYEKSWSEVGIEDGMWEGDDDAEGVPGGEGREEAVNDGVEIGDAWSSSEDSSELEAESEGVGSAGRRGRNLNLFPNRFVGVAGDCGLIGDWVISSGWAPADGSSTGMRGTNENLEAKDALVFEGAGGCDLCTNRGGNVLSMDEVLFDPLLVVVGGLEGGDDVSGSNGSNPTGTRFRS